MIDQQMGLLFDALERRGVLDNTVVIFTSDLGDCLNDHGLSQKWSMYESSVRVPALVWAPSRVKAGYRIHELVSLFDFGPTILELAGLYANATLHAPLERVGRTPEIRITCESLISAIALLQNTDCLSILPDAALGNTHGPKIVPVPVSLSCRRVRSGAIYRDEMHDWPPLTTLMKLCEARFDAETVPAHDTSHPAIC